LKIIGLGLRGFIRDKINVVDLAIAIVSMWELTLASNNKKNLSSIKAFRALRILRVTKLLKKIKFMEVIVRVISF